MRKYLISKRKKKSCESEASKEARIKKYIKNKTKFKQQIKKYVRQIRTIGLRTLKDAYTA